MVQLQKGGARSVVKHWSGDTVGSSVPQEDFLCFACSSGPTRQVNIYSALTSMMEGELRMKLSSQWLLRLDSCNDSVNSYVINKRIAHND
ncbi:hypothetical protein BLNAU_21988 [Blattamonas nauphoetae]|uniref:Uncharacterized protein n=1 Tax=Blattamonas nauphoetae TaxID=2049346 RepID=A0ABQ9WUA5_9EUKA|nr:hypothetical protein BLNAU_21988 [Blattamonas nauphoetae]